MSHISENTVRFDASAPTDAEIKLQALHHTKDKLLSVVGHDLRNAIGGVISLADMMDRRLDADDLDEARRINGLIRQASMDANNLLSDLVTWTQRNGQDVEFRLEPLNVSDLIETEVSRMRSASSSKSQTIRIEVLSTECLRADRYMLQSIIRNLLSNALKFSCVGGEVLVRAERQLGQWQFSVVDSGIGMSVEIQECLLEVNMLKQQIGTAEEVGSGSGLLLCEAFVLRHGGSLTWESAPNVGSTFTFTIPELIG